VNNAFRSAASGQPSPVASVVVMTFNRPDSLDRCLASLASQTMHSQAFEVIVVDVSTPSVEPVLSRYRNQLDIRHLPAPNKGVAANRNAGAQPARGDVLVFLDDDCVADSGWLSCLVQAVQRDPGVIAAAGVKHPDPDTATAAAGQVITDIVNDFFNPPGADPRFLPGLNFALNRERYMSIGGCDESFGFLAAEDRDFVDRWRQAGGRLVLCDGTRVRHEHRGSLRGFMRQYFNYGRGARRYHRLRRQRQRGHMWEDARLHPALPLRLLKPIMHVPARYRLQSLMLVGLWQVANLAGFLWQITADLGHEPESAPPATPFNLFK